MTLKTSQLQQIFLDSEKPYLIRVIFFQGISFISRLIKWFTRSKFSHVGFDLDGYYRVEAWENTRHKYLGIFGAKWQLTTPSYHTKGTPYVVLGKEVDYETYTEYFKILDFICQAGLPYDYTEIIKFVIKGKESEPNGKFVCSTGTCFILQYLGVLPEEIPYWRQSPEDVYELCLANGFRVVEKGVVN